MGKPLGKISVETLAEALKTVSTYVTEDDKLDSVPADAVLCISGWLTNTARLQRVYCPTGTSTGPCHIVAVAFHWKEEMKNIATLERLVAYRFEAKKES